jgi:hypothetical protein
MGRVPIHPQYLKSKALNSTLINTLDPHMESEIPIVEQREK